MSSLASIAQLSGTWRRFWVRFADLSMMFPVRQCMQPQVGAELEAAAAWTSVVTSLLLVSVNAEGTGVANLPLFPSRLEKRTY
jgi:hypothetical protein